MSWFKMLRITAVSWWDLHTGAW